MRSTRRSVRTALAVSLVAVTMVVSSCRMAPPPGTSHSPSGSLDSVRVEERPTEFRQVVVVEGWASDWDTLNPVDVMFYVKEAMYYPEAYWMEVRLGGRYPAGLYPNDDPDYTLTANLPRPDVDAAFHRGANFGYRLELHQTRSAGPFTICAVALNVGPGDNTVLGCKTVVIPGPKNPFIPGP